MGLVNRFSTAVRRALSDDHYNSLDKNIRVSAEGVVLRLRDDDGRELPDPVPIAPPVGWHKQPSMFDNIRNMVRSEQMRFYAEAQGAETFEESEDFEVEDDMYPASQYEEIDGEYDPLSTLQARRQAQFREDWFKAREAAAMEEDFKRFSAPSPEVPAKRAPATPARPADRRPEPARDEE